MTPQDHIVKLAKAYNEDKFTKEQMATDLFGSGATYDLVVKVSLQMDYHA